MSNFKGLNSLMNRRIGAIASTLFCYGSVLSTTPLTIKVDNRFDLPGEGVVLLEGVNLKVGDKVVLLRNQGGQEYLVLGRVKNDT